MERGAVALAADLAAPLVVAPRRASGYINLQARASRRLLA